MNQIVGRFGHVLDRDGVTKLDPSFKPATHSDVDGQGGPRSWRIVPIRKSRHYADRKARPVAQPCPKPTLYWA
jgi:hypothetical protein